MKFIFITILLILLFYLKFILKIKIKWKTFLQKGFKPNKNQYGVYCYCGKQGNGKSLSIIEYIYDNKDKLNNNIYINMKNTNVCDYIYIADLKDLLLLRDKTDIVIAFDEIFSEITKMSKLDQQTTNDVMDFLSQMRKRRIILLTSCQEWRLLPLYFRLYCRYQINCKMIRLPLLKGILIKNFIDGDNIKWDEQEQDFVGELIENTITHTRLCVANSYDTFETIGKFSRENTKDNSTSSPLLSTTTNSKGVVNGQEFEPQKKYDIDFWEDLTPLDFINKKKEIQKNEI